MLGVTRDTLRIYEEEGLLNPQRDHNGFRTYSERDVYRLISIKFFRESYTSIKDIKRLLDSTPDTDQVDIINKKIEEEQAQMERHKKNIARLELTKLYYSNAVDRGFTVDPYMEDMYILSELREDFFETVKDYFQLGIENPALRSCYLSGAYDLNQDEEKPVKTYLMLKRHEMTTLKVKGLGAEFEKIPGVESVRGVIQSENPLPDAEQIRKLKDYAALHHIELAGEMYAYYLYQYSEAGKQFFIIEMYAPVKVPKN